MRVLGIGCTTGSFWISVALSINNGHLVYRFLVGRVYFFGPLDVGYWVSIMDTQVIIFWCVWCISLVRRILVSAGQIVDCWHLAERLWVVDIWRMAVRCSLTELYFAGDHTIDFGGYPNHLMGKSINGNWYSVTWIPHYCTNGFWDDHFVDCWLIELKISSRNVIRDLLVVFVFVCNCIVTFP